MTVQGKRYKNDTGDILIKYGDTLGSTGNKEDKIEKLLGLVMAQ